MRSWVKQKTHKKNNFTNEQNLQIAFEVILLKLNSRYSSSKLNHITILYLKITIFCLYSATHRALRIWSNCDPTLTQGNKTSLNDLSPFSCRWLIRRFPLDCSDYTSENLSQILLFHLTSVGEFPAKAYPFHLEALEDLVLLWLPAIGNVM